MRFDIPPTLQREHQELHATLLQATRQAGALGTAAREVARVLHPHFVEEEAYALPPLALLPLVAVGQVTREMADVLPLTARLEAELPKMLAAHRTILAALPRMLAAAREAGATEYEQFAKALELHTQTEEQVLYPAAILVGRFVAQALEHATAD